MRKTLFAAFITLACVQMQAQTNDSIQHRIDSLENTVRELKATIDSNEKEKKDKSVWGRKRFLTIGYVSQSLSPKYGNDLEGSFGVSLTSGRTIYLHKKPIWGKLKFALDLGMDVNYTKYKDFGEDYNNYYEDDVFLTEAITREALSRLNKLNDDPKEKGKPFYLYMSQYAIHAPLNKPDQRFAGNYKDPKDGRPWSNIERNYSTLIEGMDKSLGDLMNWLEENKLTESTVIIFMADNGGLSLSSSTRSGDRNANFPLFCGKGSFYEGGIREPMIAYWPGVTKAGSINRSPVIVEDFFPTLLEIAGYKKLPKTVQKVDGLSFVPALRGESINGERPLIFHLPNIWGEGSGQSVGYGPQSAVIQGDWKLIYRHATQKFELYNIAEDISEKKDLAASMPDKVRELAKLLSDELRDRDAQMPTYKAGNPVGARAGSEVPLPIDSPKLPKK